MTQAHDLAKLRVQDPVLTELAQGYHNAELVSETLMPVVEIPKEAGKIPVFGRLAFRLPTTVRELHGDSNRLTPEDVTTIDVNLQEHDVEYSMDYREINESSYSLEQYALSVTQNVIALGREKEVAELAQNAENYVAENVVTLTAKEKFTHAESNPLATIYKGIEKISHSIGVKPNVCVISSDVWQVLKEHKGLLERIKYTRTAILTPETLAELIGVETVKIGEAVEEKGGQLEKLWKDCVILAYVSPRAKKKQGTIYDPSYGYTVRRQKGLFVDTYTEKGGKVKIIRCTDIHKPHLLGKSAGYLMKGCIV
ncbi:inorganic pyrophosphatase [Ursidibacter sp. B-7004-1]